MIQPTLFLEVSDEDCTVFSMVFCAQAGSQEPWYEPPLIAFLSLGRA
jgi:hypothetical protein